MENQITIREAITENDVAVFWEQLHIYHKRDIFPDPGNEDLSYFLGSEYYDHMMKIHSRPQDRCYFLFFHRVGQDIGFAMPVIFTTEDWQLKKLENGFLKEIGESPATEEKQEQLAQAIQDGKITFFVAKRGYRTVGMCSVAKCFSTFACTNTGEFDDFYIESVFRKRGVARKLAQAAQKWSKENGLASLTVTCAPCDEGMYQALGFNLRLGSVFANIT